MKERIFYTAGRTQALQYATDILKHEGCVFAQSPDSCVTHLLLGVPAFEADGTLKGGGRVEQILPLLNNEIAVVGGNLDSPVLDGYQTTDLLRDPIYLAQNADITAHCAVRLAMAKLPVTLKGCHVLILGWGRIGKCLAALLRNMGAVVTVAARKAADRAMLLTLGYDTLDPAVMSYELVRFRVIFNTAPVMILSGDRMQYCADNCLKIDLASSPGMEGADIIWARGLPSKDAPESSGELIAHTILRLTQDA